MAGAVPNWIKRTARWVAVVLVFLVWLASAINDVPPAWDLVSPWLSPFWQDLVAVLPPFVVVGLLLLSSGILVLSLLDSWHMRHSVATTLSESAGPTESLELANLRRTAAELTEERDRLIAQNASIPAGAVPNRDLELAKAVIRALSNSEQSVIRQIVESGGACSFPNLGPLLPDMEKRGLIFLKLRPGIMSVEAGVYSIAPPYWDAAQAVFGGGRTSPLTIEPLLDNLGGILTYKNAQERFTAGLLGRRYLLLEITNHGKADFHNIVAAVSFEPGGDGRVEWSCLLKLQRSSPAHSPNFR